METNENNIIKEIFDVTRFNNLIIERKDGELIYSASLNTEKELSSTALSEIIQNNPFIISLERYEDE